MLSSSSSPNSFRKPYQHRAGRDDLADSQQPREVPRACHEDTAKHIAAVNHCRQHDNAFVVDDRHPELRERPPWSRWITRDHGRWITFGNEFTQLAGAMKIEHLQHLPAAAYGCNECDFVAVVESRRVELYERAGRHPRRIASAQRNNLEPALPCKKHPLRGASPAHRRAEGDFVGAVERRSGMSCELRQYSSPRNWIPNRRGFDDARAQERNIPSVCLLWTTLA